MKQDEINVILDSFFITKSELDQRDSFNEFSHSISSIIVDGFAKDYLLNNKFLSVYLAHTDGSMLLKKIKTFIAFILTAPVDEEYVKRIHSIGFIHYSIKLDPAKVSYGFWAINEVLNKLAITNNLVSKNKQLISKLLKFVEHIMNDGYYMQENKQQNESTNELDNLNIQNELYAGFSMHKLNLQKIELAIADGKDIKYLDNITNSPSKCPFGKIIDKIKENNKHEYILGISAQQIQSMHNQWHLDFIKLKEAMKNDDKSGVNKYSKSIKHITKELSVLLNLSLKDSMEDGQLSLHSGMKAMNKMTKLFYKKDYHRFEDIEPKDIIANAIENTILCEFSWIIKKIDIDYDERKEMKNIISKSIRFNSKNIFIYIELKDNQNIAYLNEITTLLLEVLELHFFVQERELSLIKFADEAESANKSKDMFLANMSHELRTPINAITGFSQILMIRKDTPDKVKKYVEKINIAGNNLLELVNTILDFAKLESGKMQFNPSLNSIASIFNEVKTLIVPLAKKKNIELLMPKIISLSLYIDPTLFKQVLINLLTNAIKFTHEDGKVSLDINYNEKSHSYNFEIKDDGVGLDKNEISKLFQAFSQVDNVYQKDQKGSGLGLMICKSIIEDLHNGKIWVESIKGEGSSFFIEMPTPIIESNTFTISKAPKGAKNILIVEDSLEYQKILIENLQDTYILTITDTINKAKELVIINNYTFLILDFFLTDGISSEILQFMESENINIPSIVISAEDEIHISSSLSGSTNLQCIVNKNDVNRICNSIRGEKYKADSIS
ncbi:MAG: ATP-binding protein [Campylobacterota bacterium]|nr:ATP-binding protein [Campylobacterota bacterium]